MFDSYPDILTVPQVCEALSIGKNSVYSMLRDGTLQSIWVRSQYRIPKICLIEYIEKSICCNGGCPDRKEQT